MMSGALSSSVRCCSSSSRMRARRSAASSSARTTCVRSRKRACAATTGSSSTAVTVAATVTRARPTGERERSARRTPAVGAPMRDATDDRGGGSSSSATGLPRSSPRERPESTSAAALTSVTRPCLSHAIIASPEVSRIIESR